MQDIRLAAASCLLVAAALVLAAGGRPAHAEGKAAIGSNVTRQVGHRPAHDQRGTLSPRRGRAATPVHEDVAGP